MLPTSSEKSRVCSTTLLGKRCQISHEDFFYISSDFFFTEKFRGVCRKIDLLANSTQEGKSLSCLEGREKKCYGVFWLLLSMSWSPKDLMGSGRLSFIINNRQFGYLGHTMYLGEKRIPVLICFC